jgi:arginyl-tRNA synthetase
MKHLIAKLIAKQTKLSEKEIINLIETPPNQELGDYAFPTFSLVKKSKSSPNEIALNLSKKINSPNLEKVVANGPYVNFFINFKIQAAITLTEIQKNKNKYGSSDRGKGKTTLIEFSSPNIAKPFGIGHLRSTIIGNSLANLSDFLGFKTIRINYLGDWGTPFGKIIAGHKRHGSEKELKKNPIKYLLDLYIKATKDKELEKEGKELFRKLEKGDKEALKLWKSFRMESIKEFEKIYKKLNVKFDVYSGESFYNDKMEDVFNKLKENNLLIESEGAQIVNLEKYNLGISLIKKSDGATLYSTRDLAAAIDRKKKYGFDKMIYEVGSEQKLHFKQLFKILELMGYDWATNCQHVDHGLYLDKDGKKFSSRKGKTIFMDEILEETKELAKKEIARREKLPKKELEFRASKVAISAILYGDLKNHRANNIVFDIKRFLSFEGNTGPYLLYTFARAKSILRKSKSKSKLYISGITKQEKNLISQLAKFPEIVKEAHESSSPNLVANYSYHVAQAFNEFYHSSKVLESSEESFRLSLVSSTSQVLKNALALLGIETIENM